MAAVCLVALFCHAQTIVKPERDTKRKYEAACIGTASGTVPSCVVHVPSTVTATPIRFDRILVNTPTAANVVFEWGGATPAGGTAAVVRGRNTTYATKATVLSGATSASPTNTKSFVIGTGADYGFDASDDEFASGPITGRTLRVSFSTTVTGNYSIYITFYEQL
jgi:hypothetical protein